MLHLFLLGLLAGTARAEEQLPRPAVPAAEAHFDAGNAAFRSAQSRTDPTVQRTEYEQAISEYLAGVQLETKFHYTFYWNLGHAYRQLGQYTRADHFYQRFLEYVPARYSLHRTAAEDFRRMMRAELDKAASLAEPNAPAPAPLSSPVSLAPERGEHTPPAWYEDKLGWGLAGSGALAIGLGLGLRSSGASMHDRANDAQLSQSARMSLRDDASTRLTAGTVALAAGAALSVAGVVKLSLTEGRTTDRDVQVGFIGRGIALSGRF